MSYSSSPITVQIVWHWPGTSYFSPPVAVQAVQRWPGINNSEIPPTSISQHSVASLTCKLRTASSSRCTDHQQYTAVSALPAAAAFNSLTTSGTLQSLHCPQQQQASSRHGQWDCLPPVLSSLCGQRLGLAPRSSPLSVRSKLFTNNISF